MSSSRRGQCPKGGALGDHHTQRLAFHSKSHYLRENGNCVQIICAIQGVHPSHFSPTSVQFKGEINGASLCKRHQKQHLEFLTAFLRTRRPGVRIPPGAPLLQVNKTSERVTVLHGNVEFQPRHVAKLNTHANGIAERWVKSCRRNFRRTSLRTLGSGTL